MKSCGPGRDFEPKRGEWHCCRCHYTFKRLGVTTCPNCTSGDVFLTDDAEGWGLSEEEAKALQRRQEREANNPHLYGGDE